MTEKRSYKYRVRRSSWLYSDRAYEELKKWACYQVGYWTNDLGKPLGMFTFWANPRELEEALLEIDDIVEYGVYGDSFDITTGRSLAPLR